MQVSNVAAATSQENQRQALQVHAAATRAARVYRLAEVEQAEAWIARG